MPSLFRQSALFFILLLVLPACQAAPSTEAPTSPAPVTPVTPASSQSSDTLPYPVYEQFAQLAPLFQHRNDTTYVINFWATWCKPCVEELPYFEKLATDIEGKPIKMMMVSLDFKRDIATKLLKFVESRPFTLPLVALADTRYNDWIGEVDPNWGGAIPITIVYRNNNRQFVEGQFASYQELKDLVQKISGQ